MIGLWLLLMSALAQDRQWGPTAEDLAAPRADEQPLDGDRAVPDFDGRGDLRPTLGRTLLWVPRALLYPFYFGWGSFSRENLKAGTVWVEKNDIPLRLTTALTWGDDVQKVRFVPTAVFDFGFRPSFGGMLLLDGRYLQGNVQAAYGGPRWYRVRASLDTPLGGVEHTERTPFGGSSVGVGFVYQHRPDQVFFGISNVDLDERTRYGRKQFGGGVRSTLAFGAMDYVRLHGWVERNVFDAGLPVFGDPTVDEVFDTAQIPGFVEGYTLLQGRAMVALDSRRLRPGPGSGLRLELASRVGTDLDGELGAFLGGSVEGAAFWDVNGRNRTIAVRQYLGLVEPLGPDGQVPFTELVTLGGNELHRGFLKGALLGSSGLVTSLQYTWPAWVMVDGLFFVEAGNTFGERFQGMSLGRMRGSAGFGLRSKSERDMAFHAFVGIGTSRFEDRFKVDMVRVTVGSFEGF